MRARLCLILVVGTLYARALHCWCTRRHARAPLRTDSKTSSTRRRSSATHAGRGGRGRRETEYTHADAAAGPRSHRRDRPNEDNAAVDELAYLRRARFATGGEAAPAPSERARPAAAPAPAPAARPPWGRRRRSAATTGARVPAPARARKAAAPAAARARRRPTERLARRRAGWPNAAPRRHARASSAAPWARWPATLRSQHGSGCSASSARPVALCCASSSNICRSGPLRSLPLVRI